MARRQPRPRLSCVASSNRSGQRRTRLRVRLCRVSGSDTRSSPSALRVARAEHRCFHVSTEPPDERFDHRGLLGVVPKRVIRSSKSAASRVSSSSAVKSTACRLNGTSRGASSSSPNACLVDAEFGAHARSERRTTASTSPPLKRSNVRGHHRVGAENASGAARRH
jgi:hypothetical protein